MAKKLKAGSDSAVHDPQHNIGDLNKIVRECRDGMLSVRARRKELNEEAGDIRKRLKDAGVDTEVFDLNVRIYEMEQNVRANYIDAFRLCYEAMNENEQMNWVDVMETEGNASKSGEKINTASDEVLHDLRENGRLSGKQGRSSDANPHSLDTDEGAAWHDGWLKGQKAVAKEMAPAG